MKEKWIRSFLALPCDKELSDQIIRLTNFLQNNKNIKCTRPDQYHITLKFLGDTPEKFLTDLGKEILISMEQINEFHLKLTSTGIFPHIEKPRILWVGNRNIPLPLQQIVLQLNHLFNQYGYSRDDQRFKPHVTVGRVKGEVPEEILKQYLNINVKELILKANHIVWYESRLSSAGPEYIERLKIPLKHTKGRK
jgi:2'-5' RNA ligase